MKFRLYLSIAGLISIIACDNTDPTDEYLPTDQIIIENTFGTNVNLNQPVNYRNSNVPAYIRFANTGNAIDDQKALLGRILFYDNNLSVDNTIACASCHNQENAFSDTAIASLGVNGFTGRHSMRLVNAGYQAGTSFFWDERSSSLEHQVTQPIEDHIEMGFSGTDGNPTIDDLLTKLAAVDYYPVLFNHVYNDGVISEERLQECLSHFVLSIQSFDSKYDQGLAMAANPGQPFPNYSNSENRGKQLFMTAPQNGGAGCVACHAPPEFAIRDNSLNNGVIGSISNPSVFDHSNTRSPSLRDLVNPDGDLNGPLMHDGSFSTLLEVIEHYNSIDPINQQNIDPILLRNGGPNGPQGQNLNLSNDDKIALVDFLRTLTGSDMYTNVKWSNPFID